MAIDARIRGDLEKVLLCDPLDSRARPRSGETVRHRPDPAPTRIIRSDIG